MSNPDKRSLDTTQSHGEAQNLDLKSNSLPVVRAGDPVEGSEQSFQAKIRIVNDGTEVAKVYDHKDLFQLLDLTNEEVRRTLMEREVTCLNALSNSVNARIEEILTPEGTMESAIVMKRFPAHEFLFRRLAANEELRRDHLEKLADTICTFHFNPSACPFEPTQLSNFLTDLLSTERKLLTQFATQDPATLKKVEGWFATMDRLISDNKDKLNVIGVYLAEPVLGHGDLKSLNIVFSESGDVHVLDVAPYHLWQVNTRRMDAMFFKAEMTLIGREEEAKVFFDRYDSEYKRRQAQLGKQYDPSDIVDETLKQLDVVAEFYRYIIFYRLTFLGVDPERAPRSAQLLDEVVNRANTMLGSGNVE